MDGCWFDNTDKQLSPVCPNPASVEQRNGKTERSHRAAVDSEHTTSLVTWFFSPSNLMWTKLRCKELCFFLYISHLLVGSVNKCYGSHGCAARRTAEPYLLLLVSACGCVFLSLWRCKGSMVGRTSARRLCAYTLTDVHTHTHTCMHAHTHTHTKGTLKKTAPCNKATKNNRHLLLKPQCLLWSQIRAFPWQQ